MKVKRVIHDVLVFDVTDLGVSIGAIHNRYDELSFIFEPNPGQLLTPKQMRTLADTIDTITTNFL